MWITTYFNLRKNFGYKLDCSIRLQTTLRSWNVYFAHDSLIGWLSMGKSIFSNLSKFLSVWIMNSDLFLLPTTFSNTFSNRLSIFFFIPLKYYFFILFLTFLHSFLMYIFYKFQTTLTIIYVFLMRSVASITFFRIIFTTKSYVVSCY